MARKKKIRYVAFSDYTAQTEPDAEEDAEHLDEHDVEEDTEDHDQSDAQVAPGATEAPTEDPIDQATVDHADEAVSVPPSVASSEKPDHCLPPGIQQRLQARLEQVAAEAQARREKPAPPPDSDDMRAGQQAIDGHDHVPDDLRGTYLRYNNARRRASGGFAYNDRVVPINFGPTAFTRISFTNDTNLSGSQAQAHSLRGTAMNQFVTQPSSRQVPRLQNTQKTGLGNGNAGVGWAFGAPASGNAFGGLAGGAPGLAQGRPFAQVMGGGSGQGPIDMSDFPTLSGPPRPQQNSQWNSNVIRQPPVQQQQAPQQSQLQSQQQRPPSTAPSHPSSVDFDGPRSQQPSGDRERGANGGDEFPPLGNGDSMRPSNGFDSPDEPHPQPNGQHSQLPIRDASNTFTQARQAPIGSQAQSQTQPAPGQSPQTTQPSPAVKKWADMTEQDHFGLGGLSAIFETRKQFDIGGVVDETLPPQMSNSILFMGQDLNSLGMDLDSPEPLHPNFHVFPDSTGSGSMFDSRSRHPVPAFQVPEAYTVTNVPPMHTRITAFSDETLFQIFYNNPRDIMQELAAQELSAREWRWHKVLRQWLQKDTREANQSASIPVVDLTNNAPIGVPPQRMSERTERGVYIFFDQLNWRRERRELLIDYDSLDLRAVGQPNGNAMGVSSAFGAPPPGMGMSGSGAVASQGVERQSSVISGA